MNEDTLKKRIHRIFYDHGPDAAIAAARTSGKPDEIIAELVTEVEHLVLEWAEIARPPPLKHEPVRYGQYSMAELDRRAAARKAAT
ncbi:MAG: hypothetical protein Q7S95_04055 [bacterium]|nr:hypothetical protein [bacterium]